MKSKSLLNLLGSFSDFQLNMLFTNEDEESCKTNSISSSKRGNRNLDDFQIFTDHLKLNERFKKTLYYGKLPATECPSLPLSDATLELFTKTVPNGGLDVLDMHYAASVSRKACISPCSMILAIMYLDQLRHKNPEYLQNVASCDLFLISMLVASKFLYDNGEDDEVFNAEWACSANIDVKELNNLEREFLAALNWEVFIKPNEFFRLVHEVECKIALQEMSKRGWFTYTDISVLAQNFVPIGIITVLIDSVVKLENEGTVSENVIVIVAVAYVAAVLILLGAGRLCQRCIPAMQDALQVLTVGSASTTSVTTPNNTFNVGMITSVTIGHEITSYENLSDKWITTTLSSGVKNEAGLMDNSFLHSRISAFHTESKQVQNFFQRDCKDHHKAKSKLSPFSNYSVDRHFTASGVMAKENYVVVYIEPCFYSTVPHHPGCFCSLELDLWLSSIYKIGYSVGVCQKYFSKTFKE